MDEGTNTDGAPTPPAAKSVRAAGSVVKAKRKPARKRRRKAKPARAEYVPPPNNVVLRSLEDYGFMSMVDAAHSRGVGLRTFQRWVEEGRVPVCSANKKRPGKGSVYIVRIDDLRELDRQEAELEEILSDPQRAWEYVCLADPRLLVPDEFRTPETDAREGRARVEWEARRAAEAGAPAPAGG